MPFPDRPLPWIAPSIIAGDPLSLREEIRKVEEGGVDILHLDIMDGTFVPNITMGPWIIEGIRRATSLPLDVHLMVYQPERLLPTFLDLNPQMISIHFEATLHLHRTLEEIQKRGISAGVAINPATPPLLLQAILPVVDYVVVMSVNPGFAGQRFLPFVLPKISELREMRERYGCRFLIEVDGGITPENAQEIRQRGGEILVAGMSFFSAPDPREIVKRLRGIPAE
jgi:ribulose-phosphate 3-epimerase